MADKASMGRCRGVSRRGVCLIVLMVQVPDKYVDVVVAYLKTVQGGGRAVGHTHYLLAITALADSQGVIDAAKKRRDATVPIPEPAQPATEVEQTEQAPVDGSEVEEAAAKAEPEAEETPQVDPEAERKVAVAKERAVKLLKAMGAR